MASVSVFVEGSSTLGKVFGDTRRLKTSVYAVPAGTDLWSTSALRSTNHALLLSKDASTKANAAQVASALEKLVAQKGAIAARLGAGDDGLYLSKEALDVLKGSVAVPTVAVPTRTDDDVPVADEFASVSEPSPRSPVAAPLLSKDLFQQTNWKSLFASAVAAGTIKVVDVPQVFLTEKAQVPLAPAQVSPDVQAKALAEYAAQYPASPVDDTFQGSPSTDLQKDIIVYYNPNGTAAAAAAEPAPATTVSASATTQDVVATWWFWLIIVLLLIVLIVISVVAYYRR
jgi:hypothetical protein